MSIIYSILNTCNGKQYIGQSVSLPKIRWQNHLWKLNKGEHYNAHLQYAWNKYGETNFKFKVLLCGAFNIKELNKLEQDYIKLYDSFNNGYNQNEGGYNRRHTKETKLKLSKIKKQLYKTITHPWKGRKHTQEAKDKMSANQKYKYEKGTHHLLNYKGKKHSRHNSTIYSWTHKDGQTEVCTQYDLYLKYNLNRSSISKLAKGKLKTSNGWKCNGEIQPNI